MLKTNVGFTGWRAGGGGDRAKRLHHCGEKKQDICFSSCLILVSQLLSLHFVFQSLVTLHDSDDYRFVVVDDFGIVNSYAPRLARGNIQTMVYVSPFSSSVDTGHIAIKALFMQIFLV